ncbi:TetR/AcrR family transcriptional regulator [Kribbella deserti]|uniref:TetR/AcrR family transcriptional regulator n=1 Tax=Kribbella deserti TaxID=1926257 RepID=A0ABV6QN70_9ACTN
MADKSGRPRTGGRRAQISLDDILREGRRLGLAALTVNGVADALGVSPTALYRHIDGKLGLERLVGESVLAELHITDDPTASTARYLLSLAQQVRAFTLDHPGLAAYMQSLFPRDRSGVRLQRESIEALGRRGYSPEVAVMLSGTVAMLGISLTAAEERHRPYIDGPFRRELEHAYGLMAADEVLTAAQAGLPPVDGGTYFQLVMTAYIRGLTAVAPPGRPAAEVLADLGDLDALGGHAG